MMKWGDFDQIDLDLLERVNALLVKQQAVAGGDVSVRDFSPGHVIMTSGAVKGLSIQDAIGAIRSYGSVAINNFMLGYLYRLAEQGHLQDALESITADIQGGAHDTDDRTDER